MDSGDLLLPLLQLVADLFQNWFLNWIKAVVAATIAVLIRHRTASAAIAAALGAVEGLVGSRLELLDLYLTSDGWTTIDTLTLLTIVLSVLASLAWWGIARALYALMRRLMRPAAER